MNKINITNFIVNSRINRRYKNNDDIVNEFCELLGPRIDNGKPRKVIATGIKWRFYYKINREFGVDYYLDVIDSKLATVAALRWS